MDWQGQKLSEQLMQYSLLITALVALVAGYILSSYRLMLLIYVVGTCVTFLLVVPDWPFYNRHPLEWLEPKQADTPSSRAPKSKPQPAATKKGAKGSKR